MFRRLLQVLEHLFRYKRLEVISAGIYTIEYVDVRTGSQPCAIRDGSNKDSVHDAGQEINHATISFPKR
jgi:hypothetical protein